MNAATILPPLVLGIAAACGLTVAVRRGLFSPPIPVPPKDAKVGNAPLFIGAFAMFCWMMIAGGLAAVITGLRPGSSPEPAVTARTQLLAAGLQIGPGLFIAWFAWRAADVPRPTAKPTTLAAQGLGWAVLVLPAVFGIGFAAGAVSELLGHPVDKTAHSLLKLIADPQSGAATRWMLITAAVVAAPLLEEVCYRGLLQRGVARTLQSNVGAVAITALIFTAVHVPVIPPGSLWPVLVQLFSLAVALGLVAARTGSVIPSIVVHATFNAASIATALWWTNA